MSGEVSTVDRFSRGGRRLYAPRTSPVGILRAWSTPIVATAAMSGINTLSTICRGTLCFSQNSCSGTAATLAIPHRSKEEEVRDWCLLVVVEGGRESPSET